MKQYLNLLQEIKKSGTYKPAAREGMPGTQSLFGHQFRHDLSKGFPLLTTKKMFWKGVVVELLWFLRGDTNIKYLIENGVNIWNEDAYHYYCKVCKQQGITLPQRYEGFIDDVKSGRLNHTDLSNFRLGDCGFQYGRVWRDWNGEYKESNTENFNNKGSVDQIGNLLNQLRKSPESRRHLVTAIDPGHENDLALYWCHALFQFNCRPLTEDERFNYWFKVNKPNRDVVDNYDDSDQKSNILDKHDIPKYYLDCQLYQRSADVFLGVPFNIASYSLLTHILAKMCNMIPGEFIHTFGDVHIYDNHKESVEVQLSRDPGQLPILNISDSIDWKKINFDDVFNWDPILFEIQGYNPQPSIKGELSTGLKK